MNTDCPYPIASRLGRETPSKNLFPRGAIFEQGFAEQANGGRAVAQHLILEFAQGISGALLALIILTQLENLELAQGVVEVAGIESAPNRLLAVRLARVIAIL